MFNPVFSYNYLNMVKTSTTQKKSAAKVAAGPKKATLKSTVTAKKSSPKKRSTAKKQVMSAPQKVDYYPNRMTLAISALAGTLLVLIALIAVLGQS